MIFITGDTHGDIRRFNNNSFYEQKEMTKDDYVIIAVNQGMKSIGLIGSIRNHLQRFL